MSKVDYTKLLDGVRIFIAHHDAAVRRPLRAILRMIGANVHSAKTPLEAQTKYMKMHRIGRQPNRVITSWWLEDPGSPTFAFWQQINQTEQASAHGLLNTVFDLDPQHVDVTLYSCDLEAARAGLRTFGQRRIDQYDVGLTLPVDVALDIALKENIKRQHAQLVLHARQAKQDTSWIDRLHEATVKAMDHISSPEIHVHTSETTRLMSAISKPC